MIRPALCLSLALALTACTGKQPEKTTGGTADGEILPGSASDAMLPLDTVRSQPPLAPKVESSGKAPGGARDSASAAPDATASDGTQPEATTATEKPATPAPDAPAT